MIRFDSASLFLLTALVGLSAGCQAAKNQEPVATSGTVQASTEEGAVAHAAPITDEEMATLRANFLRVHFEFDAAVLTEDARTALRENAGILLQHKDVKVQIEGHADHWGSDIYNLALGQRRGETVRSYLLNYGVSNAQLTVISYGEERPLVGDGDRLSEAPNRRAEFIVTNGADKAKSSY
jgi:peptidoglycan-associated lipoprotein